MDPVLLDSIEYVEQKYGSVCNPRANLSHIHHIVKSLGLFGNMHRKHKNRLWEFNDVVFTVNPKIIRIYYYLRNGKGQNFIRKFVHVDGGVIRKVRTVIHMHLQIKMVNEDFINTIERQNGNMVKFF